MIPSWIEEVFEKYLTANLTTFAGSQRQPVSFPLGVGYSRDEGEFWTTTGVYYQKKADNIRKNPRVSLLFSYPLGSGFPPDRTPVILVQGDARVFSEDLEENFKKLLEVAPLWIKKQPAFARFFKSRIRRKLKEPYLLRLFIIIT